jgi:exodeoxyribonuclease-3
LEDIEKQMVSHYKNDMNNAKLIVEKWGVSAIDLLDSEPQRLLEIGGIGEKRFDDEGRTLVAYYHDFVLINCYFPNGGGAKERLEYKLKYYDAFFNFIQKFTKAGKKVVFGGDVNVAHTEIDLARPKENVKSVGFLPEERAWIDKLIKNEWTDTYRFKYPNVVDKYTFWDMKTRSRDRNVGWRIDYFFVSKGLENSINKVEIFDQVLGSDHCPILLDVNI